jgi:hypothetical protein
MRSTVSSGSDQLAYLLWLPPSAERALYIAYGGRVSSALVADLARHVDLDCSRLDRSNSLDTVMLIGHPAADRPGDQRQAFTDYLDTIVKAWAALKPSGRLMIAFDPLGASSGTSAGLQAWLRPRTWLQVTAIEKTVRALRAASTVRVHAFPSVWRPTLLHTPESPAVLKRVALSHVGGWRAGGLASLLLRGGRMAPLDLCPNGIVWIASR